jgi:hypothetical protein
MKWPLLARPEAARRAGVGGEVGPSEVRGRIGRVSHDPTEWIGPRRDDQDVCAAVDEPDWLFFMRPSGLEPPRTKRSTRPLNLVHGWVRRDETIAPHHPTSRAQYRDA